MSAVKRPRRRPDREPAVRRQSRLPRLAQLPWRGISLGIALLLAVVGLVIFLSPAFYVTRVEIGGNRYVPPEEIFAQSGIADFHILWVEPDAVAERLTASQSIDSAEVFVQWPARVIIVVREREPALVWQQAGTAYWVDVNGNLMEYRREVPGLVRVVNEGDSIPFRCPGPTCPEGVDAITLSPDVVSGAQQLKTLRNEVNVLYYDEAHGLSFDDPRGWRVYVGTGINMDVKMRVYEQVIAQLNAEGIVPRSVDVTNPQAPFYELADGSG
jgi:cell division septal protein FtsQ